MAILAWVILPTASSFTVVSRSACLSSSTALFAKNKRSNSDDDDDKDHGRYQDALSLNKARTDVRNLLTQRAVQSFIFLLNSCRDPHTVRWLEVSTSYSVRRRDTHTKSLWAHARLYIMSLWTHTQSNYQLKNIGSFHGTGAL